MGVVRRVPAGAVVRVFYLGIPRPDWLRSMAVPVCVSYRQLRDRASYPARARDKEGAPVPWVLDSGAFTEVSQNGRWTVPPGQYANYVNELWGRGLGLQWAGIQDWMCESFILEKTGLSLKEHQERTIQSFETLSALAPRVTWAPTLQGQTPDDYVRHFEAYLARGHDLRAAAVVGLGSVCRRQKTPEIDAILRALAPLQLRLHGYGVKKLGLERGRDLLESSDSMAWSAEAFRRHVILPGHRHGEPRWRRSLQRMEYGNCANCPDYALAYYHEMHRRFVA